LSTDKSLTNVNLKILIFSIIVGIVVGTAIVVYIKLTHFCINLFFLGRSFEDIKNLPLLYLILVSTLGAVIVSLIKIYNEKIQEYGVVRVARILEEGKLEIRVRDVISKIIASALSIGSGFAVGNEGPSAEVGAMISYYLSKLVKIPVTLLRTVIAAGASAGIAAVFISPFTGFVFGLEIMVKELSIASSFVMVLASVFGFAISSHFLHRVDFPFFFQKSIHWQDIIFPIFMVPFIVLVSIVFLRVKDSINYQIFYPLERKFMKIIRMYGISTKYKILSKAILAGIFTGILLKITPYSGFSGHSLIEKLIYENKDIAFNLALTILLARIISTSVALSWGAVGGLFMPILTIGAILGYIYGICIKEIFPNIYFPNSYFATIGAASFLGALLNVPTTAIILAFELTLNFSIIVPTAVVTIFSLHFLLIYREFYAKYIERKYQNVSKEN